MFNLANLMVDIRLWSGSIKRNQAILKLNFVFFEPKPEANHAVFETEIIPLYRTHISY
jgi:hypothetical protein